MPTGSVLRTTTIGAGSRASSSPTTSSTALVSAWPRSSIGVPTQMRTIGARVADARSRIDSDPASSADVSASWTPCSENGTSPRRRAARRSGSVSTSSTAWPIAANPTALTSPTYPAPTTAIERRDAARGSTIRPSVAWGAAPADAPRIRPARRHLRPAASRRGRRPTRSPHPYGTGVGTPAWQSPGSCRTLGRTWVTYRLMLLPRPR